MRWPPMSASPLAVRAPRLALRLTPGGQSGSGALEPRPGAEPGRPEVRTARAPATQTKRARLPAFSTGQDGAEKLADWRLGGKSVWPLAEQANSSFLPPSSACSARSQNSATPAAPTNRDPASYDSLRSGCVMKDASDSQPQELLSIVPPRCRLPLTREPLGKRVPAASSQALLPQAQPRRAFGGPVH